MFADKKIKITKDIITFIFYILRFIFTSMFQMLQYITNNLQIYDFFSNPPSV